MWNKIMSSIIPGHDEASSTFIRLVVALLSLLVPIVGLLLLVSILTIRLTKLFEDTLVRVALSILCVCALLGTLILALTPFGHFSFWVIAMCISLAMFKWFHVTPFRKLNIKNVFDKKSIGTVIGLFFGVIFISLPLLTSMNGYGIFSKLYGGEDNSAHVGMIKYSLDHHTPTYFDADSGIAKGLQTYPQGVHTATAYTIWSFNPYASIHPTMLIALYYAFFSFGVILFFVLLSALIKYLLRSPLSTPVILLACVATYTLSVRHFISYGFYTQLYCFVFLLAAIYVCITIFDKVRQLKDNETWLLYELLVTLCIGVASTWYLFLATLFLPVLFLALTLLKKSISKTLIISLTGGLISLFYVLINIKNTTSSNALLANGATYAYTNLEMGLLQVGGILLISLIAIYTFNKRSHSTLNSSVTLLTFATSAYFLSLAIRFYQYIHHAEPSYYYFKSLYLIPITIFLIFPLLLRLLPKLFADATMSLTILLIGYVIGVSLPPASLNALVSRTNTNIPPTYLHLLNTADATKTDVLVASSCSPFDSYLATKWSGMLLNTYTEDRDRVMYLSVREIIGDKDAHAKTEIMNYTGKLSALSLDLDPTIPTCVNK